MSDPTEPRDDSDRLAACPFCGSEAEILTMPAEQEDIGAGAMFVQCTNSGCMASSALIYPLGDDPKPLLLERWNRRSQYRCDNWWRGWNAAVRTKQVELKLNGEGRAQLSEAQIMKCIAEAGCYGTVKMSFESGPYSVDRPSINADRLVRAVEAAHGIAPRPYAATRRAIVRAAAEIGKAMPAPGAMEGGK